MKLCGHVHHHLILSQLHKGTNHKGTVYGYRTCFLYLCPCRARTKSIEQSFDQDDMIELSSDASHRTSTTIEDDVQGGEPMSLEFQRVSITGDDTSGVSSTGCSRKC